MLIELSKLEDGRGRVDHVYAQSELDPLDERVKLAGDAVVTTKVRRSGIEVVVEGQVETVVEVDCDRCLKAVKLPVNTEFSLEYLGKADYESSQVVELTEEEIHKIFAEARAEWERDGLPLPK